MPAAKRALTVRSEICGECPFRRESGAGWLGSNDPESFVANALTDHSTACHTMMDQTLPRAKWVKTEAQTPRCRGALTLMRNMCKLPVDPDAVKLVRTVQADRDTVFSHSREFVEYHNSSTTRSWEFDDAEED